MGFSKKMAAIEQHAIAKKRASEDMYFFLFFFPLFMFWLEFKQVRVQRSGIDTIKYHT